jgi:dihydrofolate reductase
MGKRKIILNIAISLDGYIADTDGGFAWIHGDEDKSHDTEKQFSYSEFLESIDVIIMGRNAYLDCPAETLESFQSKKIYVATSHNIENKTDNIKLIKGDVCTQILELRQKKGKAIWLFGGAGLTDPFIKADIVDEYIIGIIPTILGKGRPLFLENNPTIKLHLEELTVNEGITIIRYTKKF